MGNHVQVVTCFPNHPTGRIYPGYRAGRYLREDFEGIDVHRHWTYVTPNKGFVKKALGHFSYWPAAALISGPRVLSPHVAIGSSPTLFAAMAAAGLARRRKIPFIMEVRDLWPAIFVELGVIRNRQLIAWLERLEMRLYRQATKVVVVTESFRKKLIERSLPEEKVFTIANGADLEFWNPPPGQSELRARYKLHNRFVVLYIGAHGISHALERVLDSAIELKDALPEVQFLFVGEGAEKEKLVQIASQRKLTNVTFIEPVSKVEVRDFYALADVCLVPLRNIPLFETFVPSKMFEMMAMARPIVGSVRGEAAHILRQSGAALVIDPEDSAALTRALLHIYHLNDDARREMGSRGREFVAKYYSRPAQARKYLDVIQAAIAEYQHR
jgi:glycosyltransferase involved in cell wall biosynthesis